MFKPMKFYLTPASIPQVVAYIQKYLEENPIVSPETVQEIIRIAIQEDPDLFNGSIIPIDGTSEQTIKEYIDSLPTVDAYTKAQINAMLAAKQDNLTFDTVPTPESLNPVTSGGIDTALDLKADKADTYTKTQTDTALDLKADKADTYTKTQTDNLLTQKADKADTYTKTAIDNLLDTKQSLLTFDATPTHDSLNPVTSNGILNSLSTLNENLGEQIALKASTADVNAALAQKQNVLTFDTTPTQGSTNPVTSGGLYNKFQNEHIKTAIKTIPFSSMTLISFYSRLANMKSYFGITGNVIGVFLQDFSGFGQIVSLNYNSSNDTLSLLFVDSTPITSSAYIIVEVVYY